MGTVDTLKTGRVMKADMAKEMIRELGKNAV